MKKAENEVQVETPVTVEAQEVKTIGRKIDPTSKRQQLLSKREAAKASGTFKKGRPVIGTSKRQETLAKRQASHLLLLEIQTLRLSVYVNHH